jgi:cytochrome c-type biogenesis protein CcmF
MALLVTFLTIGSISRWKKTSIAYLKNQLMKVAVASVLLGIIVPLVITREVNVPIFLAVALALWIVLGIARDIQVKTANKGGFIKGLTSLSLGYCGMQIAHLGMAVIILGICLTSHYSVERDVRLAPGQGIEIGN